MCYHHGNAYLQFIRIFVSKSASTGRVKIAVPEICYFLFVWFFLPWAIGHLFTTFFGMTIYCYYKLLFQAKPCKHLWVGGISPSVTKEELEEEFLKFGKIEDFKFLRDRNTAFIEYFRLEDASQAMRNMNGKRLGGEQIRVDFLRSQPSRRVRIFIYLFIIYSLIALSMRCIITGCRLPAVAYILWASIHLVDNLRFLKTKDKC